MTASDSSSSAASPAERPAVDLAEASLLAPIPRAFAEGRDLDLLAPLGFTTAFAAPAGPPPEVDRGELARALAVANAGYGHPAADRLADRLADPASRVVVTGQQPGFLGGPIYTLTKAVAAARWAERLEAAGEPAVAVFWVATEDHDFAEVSRATVLTTDGPRTLDLGDDPAPLTPVGMRTLGPPVERALEELAGCQPGDRWAAWTTELARWYRPDARFGEAFCRLMAALLGERCPLLLDAMLPALKSAERPWLSAIVARRGEIGEAVAAREEAISDRGHPLQVQPSPGASPLFVYHRGARRRVEWAGAGEGRVTLRGEDGFEEDVAWLEAAIEENPGVVSPGVLARAAVQDAVLGTSVLVLGPGEAAYAPQLAPLYELLEIAPPTVFLRPQALVLGSHQLDKLAQLGMSLADFVAPELDLDRALAAGREDELLAPARARFERGLAELEEAALVLDPTLEGPWSKTRGQVERALDTFAGKVAAALARHNEIARRRASDLRETCRPLGEPQERVVATAHFPGKYGERAVAAFFEQLELDGRNLQVISP